MTHDGATTQRKRFNFEAADYQAIIREFRQIGYQAVGLRELKADQPHLFLRHDVDLCLERALEIALLEAAEGCSATYYILISTQAYNPASARSREILGRLGELGHSIGLHFDATVQREGADLETCAARECDILEDLSGAAVDSLSFHRPAPALLGHEGAIAGRPHTYQSRFTKEIAYVSDSSGGFFHGHPLDHPSVQARRALQLLTHPIWWASESRGTAEEQLQEWRIERTATIDAIAAAATAKASTRRN